MGNPENPVNHVKKSSTRIRIIPFILFISSEKSLWAVDFDAGGEGLFDRGDNV